MPPKPPKTKKKKSKATEDGSESEEVVTPPPVIEPPKPVEFEFVLLKPKLYMNENGKAIKSIGKSKNLCIA
jgi:hypothetical protein